ncbi:PolC-type DNA polymerase III [Anaerovibrio lipolyticus]|uniref:3'-5' exonuclease n=1 Tax=Anaerovibrio lipolyticus TaxID=82374 RepID=UPI0026EB2099|nr:3'-5' exonuclease [Anaerovibrio lipolyticus]MBE6105882.1 3'-5' exonuclease [Anaerovibrio lipolyticus]
MLGELGKTKGKQLLEYVPDYVVFDLETTGINCYKDSVVEISAVKVIGGRVEDEFSSLVNPRRSIPYAASRVNGITDDMVAEAPTFDKVLEKFIEFTDGMTLVGHNIHNFDLRFIYRDSEKFYGGIPGNNYVDTLRLARKYLPQLKRHSLTLLAEYYGISTEGAHRALNDCRMNQQVYEQLGLIMNKGCMPLFSS